MSPQNANNIGDLDPSTNTFVVIRSVDVRHEGWIGTYGGAIQASNGHIYLLPGSTCCIGELKLGNKEPAYDVDGGVPEAWNVLLSPHFNKG